MSEPARKKSKAFMPFMIVLFLVGIVLLQHAFLFLFIALLPSIVAYIVDTNPKQPIFITVSALNFCGLIPFIFQIAFSANMLQTSSEIMSSVYNWFIIYASAAIGWLLILLSPYVCSLFMKGMRRGQIMHIESQQKKLVEEWGGEVKRKE